MKARISDSETRAKLEIEAKLLEVRQAGLAMGAKAISGVVYEKATDESKTYEERIKDIIQFCSVGLNIKTNNKENKEADVND